MPQTKRSAPAKVSFPVPLSALSKDQLFDRGLTILESQLSEVFEILNLPYEPCNAEEYDSLSSLGESSPTHELESQLLLKPLGTYGATLTTSSHRPSLSSQTPKKRYDERMKSTPNTKTFRKFTAAMQTIVAVSKTELLAREKQAKEERKARRSSASGHASRNNS